MDALTATFKVTVGVLGWVVSVPGKVWSLRTWSRDDWTGWWAGIKKTVKEEAHHYWVRGASKQLLLAWGQLRWHSKSSPRKGPQAAAAGAGTAAPCTLDRRPAVGSAAAVVGRGGSQILLKHVMLLICLTACLSLCLFRSASSCWHLTCALLPGSPSKR